MRYSQMTKTQLAETIKSLEQEEQAALLDGQISQADIFTQKKWLARSYLMDKEVIQSGQTYAVEQESNLFTVSYLNGVMAWGSWGQSTELVAIPIAKLKISEQQKD